MDFEGSSLNFGIVHLGYHHVPSILSGIWTSVSKNEKMNERDSDPFQALGLSCLYVFSKAQTHDHIIETWFLQNLQEGQELSSAAGHGWLW